MHKAGILRLGQDTQVIMLDHGRGLNLLTVDSCEDSGMELVVIQPAALIDIGALNKAGLCNLGVRNPALNLFGMTAGRRTPRHCAADVRQDELSAEQLITETGVLAIVVLEADQVTI